MKIAIHHRKNSFSERWIEYCEKKTIPFKLVDCYKSDIVEEINDCDALMWHHHHGNTKDMIFAKELMFSLEHSGKIVFPSFNTAWHFDDKIGQKYLLESINAPLVNTFVSYSLEESLQWIKNTTFPKVFKLRGGAGATNVKLIRNEYQAGKFVKRAFNQGFPQFDKWNNLAEKIIQFKKSGKLSELFKGVYRLFVTPELGKKRYNQKGYVYFQDFIPDNSGDIRVIVIDGKGFVITRGNRENDFRASGSGFIGYPDNTTVDLNCLKVAFQLATKMKSDCVAFDFILDHKRQPLVVEVSYAFSIGAYDSCPGYWDETLAYFSGSFNPQEWMVDSVISKIK